MHMGLAGSSTGAADLGVGGTVHGGAGAAAASTHHPHPLRRGSLLSGERAVFKPVVNRIDSLELQILAHHGAVENNVIKVDLPAIQQTALNSLQLRLVATVISEVLASPLPPSLGMLKRSSFSGGGGDRAGAPGTSANPPSSGARRGSATKDSSGVSERGIGAALVGRDAAAAAAARAQGGNWRAMAMGEAFAAAPTVASSWASQRRADWETQEVRGFVGVCARNAIQFKILPSSSHHLRPSRLYCAPFQSCACGYATCRSAAASEVLRKAVRLLKQKLQQRPNTHLVLNVKRLKLELWRDESSTPFLRAEVRRVTADVMVYDDSSGSLDLQVGSLWASQVRGRGLNSAAEAAQEALQHIPPSPSTPPTPTLQPSFDGQGKNEDDGASEWWRAGDKSSMAGAAGATAAGGVGGVGQQALMALEVVKPLMVQDLERLSDQGNLRGWSPREITIHVQAQLGSPIGEMTLVRHFEAAVFPLVLHLRRSLFTDLAAFSSEAVAALSAAGAGQDSGAAQREEQIKASFLTSRKAKKSSGRSGLGRSRLRRTWKGKGSSSVPASSAAAPVAADADEGRRSRSGTFSGSTKFAGPSTTWDSASDAGEFDVTLFLQNSGVSAAGAIVAVEGFDEPEAAAREADEAGVMAKPMAVKHLRLGEVNVFLTYMGNRYLELEDVDNVHLKLHPLVYTNKTWTPRKLLFRMRRDVILDVLSQVSRNFSNLGNFLNTRVQKSGATSNVSSSSHAGATSSTARGGSSRRGSANNAAAAAAAAATTARKKSIGRTTPPELLSDALGAASRSVSPAVRSRRALSLKGRMFPGTGSPTAATTPKASRVGGEKATGGGRSGGGGGGAGLRT
ncbi:unnamed protein product, partial [Scytosiphon promiscuus]